MTTAVAIRGILRTDGLRIRRDRFLLGMVVYIVGISLVMRWAIPALDQALERRLSFDLTPWYPLAVSHIVIQLPALLGGILGGLLLVEAREDHTLKAQLVAPVSLGMYVAVLGTALGIAAIALTMAESAIIGIGLPPYSVLIAAAVAGAPAAIGFALFIGTLADNKTEALVYLKIGGLGPMGATGAYFLSEPWQWIAAVYPPYWAAKAYWVGESGGAGWGWWAAGGLAVSAVWLVVLRAMFFKAAHTRG